MQRWDGIVASSRDLSNQREMVTQSQVVFPGAAKGLYDLRQPGLRGTQLPFGVVLWGTSELWELAVCVWGSPVQGDLFPQCSASERTSCRGTGWADRGAPFEG